MNVSAAENKQLMQNIFSELSKGNGKPFVESLADGICWTIIGSTKFSRTYRGKQAVLKPGKPDVGQDSSRQKGLGRSFGLCRSNARSAQYAPAHVEEYPRGLPMQQSSARADFDVVCMGAEAQNRKGLTGPDQRKRSHGPAIANVRGEVPLAAEARHGVAPCSTMSSRIWRSFSVSMARQKPSCL